MDGSDIEKFARNPFAAGIAGSFVALKFAPGLSWWERAFNVACGCLIAGFCTPILAGWLQLTSAGIQAGAAFTLGLFGLSMASAVTQAIREVKLSELIASWFTRKG